MKRSPRARLAQILLTLALPLSLSLSLMQAQAAEEKKNPPPKPSGAALLQLDDGRAGRGNLIATMGIRGFSKPTAASAHALIMVIGDYPAPLPKLKGTALDADAAQDIARRMGVPDGNMRVLRDGELTLEGIRQAFDELEARLSYNDQVFVYFSGLGARQSLSQAGGQRCAETLLTAEGERLPESELASRLKGLSAKAQKAVVFLDTSYSDGRAPREVGKTPELYTAKSYLPKTGSCPPGDKTPNQAPKASPGDGNLVQIAAARAGEAAFDLSGKGGAATLAWQTCLAGAAKDLDGSGGLSAEELRACAQEGLNRQLAGVAGIQPPHLVLTGNTGLVLSYALAPSVEQAASPSSARGALKDLYNNRDDRRLVSLTSAKPSLVIGRDSLDLTLSSREGGYVYLLMVGSDGQTFDLLFPNQLDRNNLLEPGGELNLPRASWQLSAEGPAGKDMLLAIVADGPRDFSSAGLQAAGPFSEAPARAAKDIQLVTTGASAGAQGECKEGPATRNIGVRKRCSPAYGAALLTIEEVAP